MKMQFDDIRSKIRSRFAYLTNEHDFTENSEITSDDIYAEVKFTKTNWTLSIKTISHGTDISLTLISPEQKLGFLSYYLRNTKGHENLDDCKTKLDQNIKQKAEQLRIQGKELLESNPERLNEILKFLIEEHQKLIKN